MAVPSATCSICLLVFVAWLCVVQQTASEEHVCTSPFQATDSDPNACFLHPPEGTKDKELYCKTFEYRLDIERKAPIYYQQDIDVCFYHLVPLEQTVPLEDGCCSGGLPPGR